MGIVSVDRGEIEMAPYLSRSMGLHGIAPCPCPALRCSRWGQQDRHVAVQCSVVDVVPKRDLVLSAACVHRIGADLHQQVGCSTCSVMDVDGQMRLCHIVAEEGPAGFRLVNQSKSTFRCPEGTM